MRLVWHRDDDSLSSDGLASGDLLHLSSLEGSRNDVLSDAVRRGLLGKNIEGILRQPRRQVFGHVTAVVWVGAGLAAFDRHTPASIRTGQVGRKVQIEEGYHRVVNRLGSPEKSMGQRPELCKDPSN